MEMVLLCMYILVGGDTIPGMDGGVIDVKLPTDADRRMDAGIPFVSRVDGFRHEKLTDERC